MKDRILQAFMEEAKDKHLKFTMDDLANRLGISKRTLYQHFSSKKEMLDEIIDTSLKEIDEKTETIVQDDQLSLTEKIRGVITVVPKYNDFFDWKLLEQMKKTYPEQWKSVHVALNEWEALRGLIDQGIKEGIIADQNVSLLIKIIIDAANATLDRQFFLENSISVDEALDTIVDMLLFGIVKK
ncbi:TetR/AcrR family transcriptional regulator [Paraliobacillus salinarum]|uniref:TetR/AcrR family transcriptional regulator n=1 Tax=Paraliobacillus salinarum TaxID=1158996 RepID=UPI0015F6DDD0|nr:TetR/AcrR family transcriptional regulator [Paraliobacillus salinarum]